MVPKNRQAEQAVIGSLLMNNHSAGVCDKYITSEMFFHDDTRIAFGELCDVIKTGIAVDIVTLNESLRRSGNYDRIGGAKFLQACMDAAAYASHIEHYAKIVAACYYEREVIRICGDIVNCGGGDDTGKLLGKMRDVVMRKEALTAAMTFDYSKDLISFCESLGSKKTAANTKTGLGPIDDAWRGTRGGEVNIWGAATNVGKSLMLLNLMHLAAESGKKCLYVGTEMSAHETTQRHLSISSGMSAAKIRSGNIDMNEMCKLNDTIIHKMSNLPIHIYDSPEPSIEQIEAVISSTKAEIVYLDYLERFRLPSDESMRLRVKEFMRRTKSLARKHDVEIHLAAQLNRTTYGTEEKRPSLADLSESSAVEKEADRVMLLWRPKMKQPQSGTHSVIECIQAKNRHAHMGLPFDLYVNNLSLKISAKEE